MNHFGYRMRYNKLTKPDAKVDTGLMERQFNSTLRKTGALSFRALDVDFDYDRKFILIDSVMGRRIDEALDWIREQKYDLLSDLLKDKFDYLQRRYMLEALKAREAVKIVAEHLAIGRKVLVFHDYKKGGVRNPFIFSMTIDKELNDQISDFNTKFSDIINEFDSLPSPIDLFRHAFRDDVMIYNGSIPSKERIKLVQSFNDDNSGKNLILVQSASAKEGVSFHDTTGKHPRVLFNLGLPTQPTTAIQQEGRIYRVGQESDAMFRYLNTGTSWERWAFATTIAQRASTAENLAAGEGARALKQSFIDGFQDSDTYPAGFEGEGKGGKEIDKAAASAITEFDRAKTYYFGQGKKTSRNKSAEGKDYFATPEPVGWFMTQLADARTGDSMLEPSAGHGAIARFFRDDAKTTAIEPSGELSSRLAMVFDGDVKRMDFEDLDIHNKYHTIVMNPPFGVGGKVAIEHLDKATKHLPMNGRVVALIPEGGTADKRFDKWLYGDDKGAKGVEGLYLAANISLPTCTFERAGTQVKTRIVVIDRVSNDDAKNIHARNIDLSSIEDINKLFDRIEDLTVQPRNVTEQKEEAPKPTANTSANTAGDKYITSEPETTYTTKKGKVLHGVIAKDIDLAEAQKFDKYAWKRDGGIFIRMDNVARPDSGTALFSKASILPDDAKPKGITESQANEAIEKFKSDLSNIDGVEFKVYANNDEAFKDDGSIKGRVKGFYKPKTRIIGLIRSSIDSMQDATETLRHEALGHFGLNLLTPADKLAFLASISHDKNTNALRPFFDDVVRDYPEMGQDEFMQAEEVFAKIAEEQPTALTEWLDRKLLKLSPLLRKVGFLKGHVTKAEMRKMVKSLAEGIRRGARQQNFPKNNQSQFSRSTPTNTPSDNESLTDKFNNTFSQKNKDTAIYQFQDKYIDLKRKMQSVVKNGGAITETQDARTAEELYHKRLSQRNENFLKDELNPILKGLHSAGITMAHFQTFLHAQHAPSRNKVMAQRNPNQTMIDEAITDITDQLEQLDHQSAPLTTEQKAEHKDLEKELKRWTRATPFQGTEDDRLALSGMSNAEASAFINGLSAQDKLAMTPLAKRVYAINNKTLDLQVSYGLEKQDTIDGLRSAWDNYVPLHRDEAHPDSYSHPIGSGFSVKGSAFKNALGSNSEVTNILTHIAMAREQALVRGEKTRVEIHLANFLTAHPDPDFATVGKVPTIDTLVNGFKETNVGPSYRNKPNYVMMRIKGKDIGIEFNERNESAVRLALALKNLDGVDLDKFESFFAKGTRWMSAVNTQYNLVFGIMNLMRDVSGGAINLSSTPLAGKQAQVMKAVFPALQAIYGIERGLEDHELSALYKEYGLAGATTGFRDLFADVNDRKKAIIREFERHDDGMPIKTLMAIGQWLSDFNMAMENAVRLAAYKVARESGLSIDKSASIAKNITVNFNRKGAATTKIGAFYAFFNASMQGSARMIETLSDPSGKKIIASGVALGAISALIGMAAMGDDDWDKIPEHIRERNLIIPNLASRGDYFAIPLPLGFNILPNIGRKTVEAAFGSNRISKTQRFGELLGSIIGTFNPLGGGDVIQALTPTVADPAVALIGNKDWTGKTIYKEDFNALNPTPGFTRAKSTATTPSKLLAEGLNKITGGTDYKQGAWSPTPDQIDYIFAQLTGGTGRELMHIEELAASLSNDQEVPMYKIPLLGKLYGETSGNSVERGLYYENVKRINAHHEEIDGLRAETNGGSKVNDYLNENPEAGLIGSAKFINKSID
jgi:hypothetical protein